MIYWDTSCVLKLYAAESDSEAWEKVALRATAPRVASALLEAELAFAFAQKEQRGDTSVGSAAKLLHGFRRDVAEGRFRLFPIGADVIAGAADVAALCYHAKPRILLRTVDGLHLATAVLLQCKGIATADQRLKAAAALMRMPLVAAH